MFKACPECGSTDILPDLLVLGDETPPHVALLEPRPAKPPLVWQPKVVAAGFRATICGHCGYTRFYTKHQAELLEAYKKGYASRSVTVLGLPL
jgi:predicted nucleic-acid-binding Zn-ribbon protein